MDDPVFEANVARYDEEGLVARYLIEEPYHRERILVAASLVREIAAGDSVRLLEVGSGGVGLMDLVADLPVNYLGSIDGAKSGHPAGADARWTQSVEQEFDIDGQSFDVCFAGDIIEHLFAPVSFLKNIHSALDVDGHLVLTTPNLAAIQDRFRFLVGKSPRHVDALHEYLYLHIRPLTATSLKALLLAGGFETVAIHSNRVTWRFRHRRVESSRLARWFPGIGNSLIVHARPIV